jgi:hypothetical protein
VTTADRTSRKPIELILARTPRGVVVRAIADSRTPGSATFALSVHGGGNSAVHRGTALIGHAEASVLATVEVASPGTGEVCAVLDVSLDHDLAYRITASL